MPVDISPRPFARRIRLKCGSRVPNTEKRQITPTPFGQDRAREIANDCMAACRVPSFSWMERADDHMTDGELAYVLAVWDAMPGWTCWADAFNRIWRGQLEE